MDSRTPHIRYNKELVSVLGEEESAIDFAQEAARDLLRCHPEITAMFLMSENIAIGALHALHQLSVAIPREMSLVSCGDFLQTRYLFPPLTVVDIPFARIGYLAMRTVHHQLLDSPDPDANRNVVLKGRIVERASAGPPRRGPIRVS